MTPTRIGSDGGGARHRRVARGTTTAALIILLIAGRQAIGQTLAAPPPCGDLGKPFGDYLVDTDKVNMSARFHFTPEVESLIRGKSTHIIGADLNFTLIAFPNHHRALVSTMRLAEKEQTTQPEGMTYSVECYFDRAIRFRPNDLIVRMLYATFLVKKGRQPDATAQLEYALTKAGANPFTHYNIGLVYFDMKRYDRALQQAHKAHALGLTRTELSDGLKKVGAWKEAALEPVRAASSPANDDPAQSAGSMGSDK